MHDKEKLYEETILLKNHVNFLGEDNLKLRTKISNLEKEASKFERMMMQKANQFETFKEAPTGTKTNEVLKFMSKHLTPISIDLSHDLA